MNKSLLIVSVLGLLPGTLYAQVSALDSDIDAEIEAVTAGRTAPQVATGTPSAASIAPKGSVTGGQPIYILNQATPTSNAQVQQSQVQAQPQVDILAAPLTKSRAEQIREARQQAEVETENKIVEKLEASRMEDEKRRASILFAEPFNQMSQQNNISAQNVNVNQPQTLQQPIQQQVVPVQPVQYVPVQPVKDEAGDRDLIRDEIRAALAAEAAEPIEPLESRYFGASVGVGEFPEVGNISDVYSLGLTYGTQYDSSYAVEGSFIYSDYKLKQYEGGYYPGFAYYVPYSVDIQQYTGSLTMKYFLMDGMIKPLIGATGQYSYRNYSWSQDQVYPLYNATNSATSHAVDAGLVAGADIAVNKKWSLSTDFRYLWNITSRMSGSSFLNSDFNRNPVEKLQYWNLGVTAKVIF